MHDRRCFVQLIHPGGEHRPDRGRDRTWNVALHRRKFLKTSGTSIDRGASHANDLIFWGEWEPESTVIAEFPRAPEQPSYLWDPYYVRHADGVWRQNTDPFVFGDSFHYTGCLQHTRRGPTQLRYLAPGSVILFGSCIARSAFVLDTAFVVADHVDHDAATYHRVLDGKVSETYRDVTIEPWYQGPIPARQSHRLYFGATPTEPVGGMFSFFPSRQLQDPPQPFSRPRIDLPSLVSPNMTQGKKIERDISLADAEAIWTKVCGQVEEQGLSLGVHAALPERRPQ